MEHNLQQHRGQLLLNPSYCASPVFLSGIGWEVESSGDILIDKATDENTVACVVGHLKEHHFFVTPNGNYSTVEYGDFSHTKFHFVIGNPECTLFAEDFLKALDVISKLQAQIASTPNRVNFIASAGRSKVLRFTRPVFKKRITEIDPDLTDVVDEIMENWPVRDELKVELDKIKFKFEARPLPVYVGDHFIKPEDVHAMLKGALVEVHFELKHFCIKKKKEDSFNAFVQQVIILQPGKARPVNAFKRRNIFQGLIRPAPNSGAPAPALSTGASTQSEDCVNQRNDKADDNGVDTSVSKALAGPSGKKNLSKEGDIDASPSGSSEQSHTTDNTDMSVTLGVGLSTVGSAGTELSNPSNGQSDVGDDDMHSVTGRTESEATGNGQGASEVMVKNPKGSGKGKGKCT